MALIRVLVIDDSAHNRRALSTMLGQTHGIEVVGRAADGQEGLQQLDVLTPDVVTLDLEMPKLDGFAFLRMLKMRRPTPVIVFSSYAHEKDVFKALELGAFDFVAKPSIKSSLEAVRVELVEKIFTAATRFPLTVNEPPAGLSPPRPRIAGELKVVGIAASTGGPPALTQVIRELKGSSLCLLIAQHMPERFTHAFAARLDKLGSLGVSEAKDGDVLGKGRAFIAPGGMNLEVEASAGKLVLVTRKATEKERHVPSADRLFASLARVLGARARGVVLTGMGDDGAKGSWQIIREGGSVWVESPSTAVVPSMPEAALRAGARRASPLSELIVQLKLLG